VELDKQALWLSTPLGIRGGFIIYQSDADNIVLSTPLQARGRFDAGYVVSRVEHISTPFL
jgi:hypothetical protein